MKVNLISVLYALIAFIPFELTLNVYRISRLTNWDIDAVNNLTNLTSISVFIGGTILIYFLTKNWLVNRKANFATAILWLPYFVLLVFIFASLFPLTYGGDDPNPIAGLLAIGGTMGYPFYILLLNSLAMARGEGI